MLANIEIAWPYVLLILPLPFILRVLLSPLRIGGDVLWVPYLSDYQKASGDVKFKRSSWPFFISSVAWLLLLFAAARPQWVIEEEGLPISGRDLVIAVDLSESMRQTDFEIQNRIINRLEASKLVAGDFIKGREGDRIGLIVFGTQAYLQAPLTRDRETVRILLDETSIGLAGSKTAIGDAIGLAVKRFREAEAEQRVLILMTDGANTAGEVGPAVAARLAATVGLRIYTIGIGNQEELVDDFQYKNVSNTFGLDEKTLKHIARLTGGEYYRAADTGMLKSIYNEINELEPVESIAEQLYRYEELYAWPLALAFFILLFSQLLNRYRA